MARSSAFGFTNTTDSVNSLTQKALGLTQNYALSTDDANTAVLNNRTAPIDAEEIVTFKSRNISNINTSLNLQNPSPVKGGVWYSVEEEATLVTTDSTDPAYRVDCPICVQITFKHPRSGDITATHVETILNRAISNLRKADGTWRFLDLMRGAERPVVD